MICDHNSHQQRNVSVWLLSRDRYDQYLIVSIAPQWDAYILRPQSAKTCRVWWEIAWRSYKRQIKNLTGWSLCCLNNFSLGFHASALCSKQMTSTRDSSKDLQKWFWWSELHYLHIGITRKSDGPWPSLVKAEKQHTFCTDFVMVTRGLSSSWFSSWTDIWSHPDSLNGNVNRGSRWGHQTSFANLF